MRHLAAYLLLVLGGNASPSATEVTAALEQVGVEVDETRLNALIGELEGKDLEELITLGREKLQKASASAGAVAAAPAGGADAGAAEAAPAKEVKQEAEEVDLGGGMDMFGGGDGGSY